MGGGTKKALHAWTQAQSCCCIFLKITMDLTRLLLTCMQLTKGTHSSVAHDLHATDHRPQASAPGPPAPPSASHSCVWGLGYGGSTPVSSSVCVCPRLRVLCVCVCVCVCVCMVYARWCVSACTLVSTLARCVCQAGEAVSADTHTEGDTHTESDTHTEGVPEQHLWRDAHRRTKTRPLPGKTRPLP